MMEARNTSFPEWDFSHSRPVPGEEGGVEEDPETPTRVKFYDQFTTNDSRKFTK